MRRERVYEEIVARMSPKAREFFRGEIAGRVLTMPETMPEIPVRLSNVDYFWRPVDMRTFVEDPKYLGSVLRGNIYGKVLDDLIELFDGDYSEVLLTGAIGWGQDD